MSEITSKLIAMLSILKENSYSGNPQAARDFTIVKDCKKEVFDFIIDQAISYIHNTLNFLYHDTDSVKDPREVDT